MNDLEKLEYIHCVIQEVQNGVHDDHMLDEALSFVEDIREPLLPEPDDDEEPRVPWLTRGELWALEQKDKKDD
tara:strand:- start:505 stop:723 length:219 start_codon:yes stop_codon:yes gene_type:complete